MYKLKRPPSLSGTGPLEVYRALSVGPPVLRQTPQCFVRRTDAFKGLFGRVSPTIAAALHAANVSLVPKVWTELAYESVRAEILPSAPSRLDALYAFADPFEAFSFTEETRTPHQVHRGMVLQGTPWQLVDMGSFSIVQPVTPDEAGYDQAWAVARTAAVSYWLTGQATPNTPFRAEILVGGELQIDQQPLRLLEVMTSESLVAP